MYIPNSFAATDESRLFALMRDNPFATLVSPGQAGPQIAHLPLLLDADRRVLCGHFAAANPQSGAEGAVVAVFHGPHAYVSPSWYVNPGVPTWNYATAHVRGQLRHVADAGAKLEQMRELVAAFEPDGAWTLDQAPHLERMLEHIVTFEIAIETIEGKFKMSQNRPADRPGVIEALAASPYPEDRRTAAFMLEQP